MKDGYPVVPVRFGKDQGFHLMTSRAASIYIFSTCARDPIFYRYFVAKTLPWGCSARLVIIWRAFKAVGAYSSSRPTMVVNYA